MGVLNDKDMVDIGLTSLVAFTLNKSLPKARIIKELDDNIQKYKDENISERDVFLLSTRIANGQIRNLEKLNELASSDTTAFNKAVKEDANKQTQIESERGKKLDEIIKKFEVSIEDLKAHKTRIDEKNEKLKTDYEQQLAQKEEEFKAKLTAKTEEVKRKEKSHTDKIHQIELDTQSQMQEQEKALYQEKLRNVNSEIDSLNKRKTSIDRKVDDRRTLLKTIIYGCEFLFIIGWLILILKLGWNEMEMWTYIVGLPLFVIPRLYIAIKGRAFCVNAFIDKKCQDYESEMEDQFDYSESKLEELNLNSATL